MGGLHAWTKPGSHALKQLQACGRRDVGQLLLLMGPAPVFPQLPTHSLPMCHHAIRCRHCRAHLNQHGGLWPPQPCMQSGRVAGGAAVEKLLGGARS